MIFQGLLLFFCLASLAGGSPIENLTPIILFSKNYFFLNIVVTCDRQKKVLSSQNVLPRIFLEIRYLIWRYAHLNRLLGGSSLIQLNIEPEHDNRTVCCNHKTVVAYLLYLLHFSKGRSCPGIYSAGIYSYSNSSLLWVLPLLLIFLLFFYILYICSTHGQMGLDM